MSADSLATESQSRDHSPEVSKSRRTEPSRLLMIGVAFPLASWVLFAISNMLDAPATDGMVMLVNTLLIVCAMFGGGLTILLCLGVGITSLVKFLKTKDVEAFRFVVASIALATVSLITFTMVSWNVLG